VTTAPVTTAPVTTAPVTALIPQVCWGDEGADFGFDNRSSVPVAVPAGEGNRLDGGIADDNPLHTTLFAPGRTAFAFWVVPVVDDSGARSPIVWTLTGPDGVERSATADDSTPGCDDALAAAADDSRVPELVVSDESITPAGDAVALTVAVAGVPDLSVCNQAFNAEPVGISLDEATLPTVADRTASYTLPLQAASTRPGRLASVRIVANIVDRCSYDGLTVSTWPVARQFTTLGNGVTVCAWVDDAGILSVELTPGLCELGVTGGARNRPG
jgi:hypothetical protein